MRQTDLNESPLEKLETPKRPRPTVYNWGLIISVVLAIAFFFVGLYLQGVFFPNQPVTILVAFQIIYLIFLIFFMTYSAFGLYHAFRFGFQGDLTLISTILYIIVSLILIIISWGIVF